MHTGPIQGLDFNPPAINLLSSGGTRGEVRLFQGYVTEMDLITGP
jgi:hypothetical protein